MSEVEYNETDSQIDQTQPGSGRDGADGVQEQLDVGDTLDDRGLSDPLDEGYSPPDRDPNIDVPTPSEEAEGLSLDERLSEEEPEVGADTDFSLFDENGSEVGDARAGRLVDPDLGAYSDTEKDLLGSDVGIDGAGASAEEAAVHVIDDEADEF